MGKTKQTTQNKLTITQQPPSIFANQQRGKRHGFVVAVETHSQCACSAVLKVELLYADDFTRVPETSKKKRQPHKILQVLEPAYEFNTAGEARVLVRINDVSRNHRGRWFCLNLSVVKQGVTTAFARTTPIKVISKDPKRKRSSSSPTTPHSPEHARKRCCTDVNSAVAPSGADWNKRAFDLLKSLKSRVIGFGPPPATITQCPSCLCLGNPTSLQHAKNCPLIALLNDFEQHSEEGSSSESGSECTLSSEEEDEEVSLDDFLGCGTTVVEDFEEQCEASCLLPSTQVDCDAEEASPFDDSQVFDDDEFLAFIDPISPLDPIFDM